MGHSLFRVVRLPLAKFISGLLIALLSGAPTVVLAQVETTAPAPDVQQSQPTDAPVSTDVPILDTTLPGASPAPTTDTSTSVSPAGDQSAVTDTTGASADTSQAPTDVAPATPTTDAKTSSSKMMTPMGAGSGNIFPTIPAPNVLSLQTLQPKVEGTSGALTFRIPLDIPPGRNGLQPNLALVYNSQSTQDGIFGYGWDISIPSIVRVNKTGSNTLYSAGYFSSTLDGELATTSTSTPNLYRGRVDESRRTYSFSSNTWTVYDKNGTRYLFGSASQSQLAATTSPSNVYRWMLDEIRDTNDNYVKFTYTRDGNQLYPDTITYTGHGVSDGIFTVVFTKSSRPDPYVDYRPGFRVTTNYRITQITANVNGSQVRQYALGYSSGNNGSRSLLNSIQESGSGDSGTTTLPPLTLSYVSTSTQFTKPGGLIGPAWIAADINGDGLNDNSVFYLNGIAATTSLVNGVSSYAPDYWATYGGSPDTNPPLERGVRFLDINADGKADIIKGYFNYTTGASSTEILLSRYVTGCGTWSNCYAWYSDYAWSATTTGISTVPQIDYDGSGSINNMSTGVFADVNGDGLPDFLQRVDGYYSAAAHLGNGSGWVATTSIFQPPTTFPLPFTPTGTNLQFVDINGDGLPDAISSNGSVTTVSLNTGTGWGDAEPQWTIATTTLFSSGGTYYDRGIRFVDINGDGLPDFVHSYSGSGAVPEVANYSDVLLNTGSGWATTTAYSLSTIYNASSGAFNELANWIGNGQMAQDVVSTITYPKGGSTSVSYANSTQTGQNPQLPYELLIVASVVNHDGSGSNEETDYSYSGAQQYYPAFNLPDRKFAGFASTTVTTPLSITTTYYDQNDGVATSSGEQTDGYAQINHPYREDIFSTGGTLLRRTLQKWDAISHGNVNFLAISRRLVQDYAGDGTHRDTAIVYSFATSTDDLTQIDQYGEVTGNSDGTLSDTGTDGRVTRYTYASATTTNLTVVTEKTVGSMLAVSTTSIPTTSAPVNVLVVGGGAGGGAGFNTNRGGGGGGAGGVLFDPAHTVSAQSYSITVGAGGAGSTNSNYAGSNGNNSVFDTLTATGGGGGGSDWQGPTSGGSGGGDDAAQHGGAAGTSGQGYAGGSKASGDSGAGGGGATQAGQVTTTGDGGAGGSGYTSSISGASVTYAGGGGGGASTASGGGAGGSGGGGSGGWASGSSPTNKGTAGTANTGGGGGGGKGTGNGNTGNGGDGGSGIVIIAAPIGVITSASGGTHTTAGSNDIWTFSSGGTWTINTFAPTVSTSTVPMATSSDTRFYYDGLAFGSVATGNQTRQENWKSGSSYASSTAAYNMYGLVASSADRNGKTTLYGYDAYNLYPASTTNPLGQTTQQTFNYANGQVIQTTDPNGRLTKNLYDGIGRVIEKDQSDLTTPASLVTATTFTYTDNSSPPSVVKRSDYLTATTTVDSYAFFDGLGREIQKRAQHNSGSYAVSDKTYDSAGLLHSQSLPYFSPGTSFTTATSTTALFTTFAYDALNRQTAATNAVGSTTNAYSKWTTSVTDANGHVKDFTKDAFGNLVQVVEHASSNYTTAYGYDTLDNLASTTDALGNVRAFTYDGLSRRLTATDLHAPADATFGTYTYSYDDNGNLTSVVDPKSQTTNRTYDALNRLTSEDFTGASGTEATFAYDSCTYGIGLLCTASSTAAKLTNSYDVLGRIAAATTTINSVSYPVSTSYDRQGNAVSIVYPTGSRVTYAYGAGGLVNAITRTDARGATSSIATFIDYAPTGQTSLIAYPNGITSLYSYDPLKLYRLTRLITATTTSGTTTVSVAKGLTLFLVGGGGGGSSSYSSFAGRGGGGGGQVLTTFYSVTPQSYTAAIGAGGSGGTGNNNGIAGDSSSFGTTTAAGGAGGTTSGGASGSGNSGGSQGGSNPYFTGGGGAGNGGAGSSGGTNNGGNGGSGTSSSITGTTTSYAGGGGGGACGAGPCTNGTGQAGGGSGGSVGGNASANTGSGGGGGAGGGLANGGNGGSGIIIIAYPTGSIIATGGATSTVGTTTVHTFTSSGTFQVIQTATTTATTTYYIPLQDRSFTYDAVGNITQIVNAASTTAAATTTYSYDNLNRLITASTTNASTTPYSLSYVYDALGSITSVTGTSTTNYTYAQTGYANPHAPTTVGGVSFAYDNNGNLAQQGSTAYSWDYLNRLTQSVVGTATTTYGYDTAGARVFQTAGASTTAYISRLFSVASTTSTTTPATNTEYVFLGDTLLAQLDQPSFVTYATSTPAFVATTTNVTTTASGTTTRQWLVPTSSASNRLLVLSANIKQATAGIGKISSAYLITDTGTTSLIKATTTRQSNMQSEVWYLVAPSSASSTITVCLVGSTTEFKLTASLFSGISQVNPLDLVVTKSGTTGNPAITATTTAATDLIATTLTRDGSTDATTSRTASYKLKNGILGAGSYTLATTTTGYTDTYTGSASANWSMISAAFRAATSTIGATPAVSYVHPDQLGSTVGVSDASANIVQTLDYYPYGGTRVSAGAPIEQRQYIGQFADGNTGLSYLNARYYDPSRGQFTSQDPVFWEIGLTSDGKNSLANPQSLNSYAYANGNPIVSKDPQGRTSYGVAFSISSEIGFGYFMAGSVSIGINVVTNPSTGRVSVAFPVSYGAVTGSNSEAITTPQQTSQYPIVIGASAGPSVTANYSPNTTSPDQLFGTSNTTNVSTPWASFSFSGTPDNMTYSGGPGAKPYGSVSRYPVQTIPWAQTRTLPSPFTQSPVVRSSSLSSALQNIKAQLQSIASTLANIAFQKQPTR